MHSTYCERCFSVGVPVVEYTPGHLDAKRAVKGQPLWDGKRAKPLSARLNQEGGAEVSTWAGDTTVFETAAPRSARLDEEEAEREEYDEVLAAKLC
eukprot:m.69577 g.69577  ORF g.69577 m.69577 type:complete len:96 (+) comp14134_c0_seq7:31-318(+)